jgi:hypothetical protein
MDYNHSLQTRSHLTDLRQLGVFGTLHNVYHQQIYDGAMADTMPQEDIGGVYGVDDKGCLKIQPYIQF